MGEISIYKCEVDKARDREGASGRDEREGESGWGGERERVGERAHLT